jgi:inhibitor of KinA
VTAARIQQFGDSALLVEIGDRIEEDLVVRSRAIADAWEALGHGPAVPAYASVVVRFDPLRLDPAEAERQTARLVQTIVSPTPPAGNAITVPTRYDGPDLQDTATRSGISVEELVALHSRREYRAFFLGFLPGFAYCGLLDPRIVAPRLARPRERVPAGSVAIADGQTAIYPLESPGGWRLIGRTDLALFDVAKDPPALIRPGDRVRFVPG